MWSCSEVLIIKCCCRQFVGLMGTFSFHFKYGRHSVYVNYGNEKSGILYGQVWLNQQSFIVQSCGENCALWCDLDEQEMGRPDGWVVRRK